jgi:hypothetical protein
LRSASSSANITVADRRLPYTRVNRLSGSVSSAVARIDSTGRDAGPGGDRGVVAGAVG